MPAAPAADADDLRPCSGSQEDLQGKRAMNEVPASAESRGPSSASHVRLTFCSRAAGVRTQPPDERRRSMEQGCLSHTHAHTYKRGRRKEEEDCLTDRLREEEESRGSREQREEREEEGKQTRIA